MNTPNKLTVLRILLIPVFLFALLTNLLPYGYAWALLIFLAASLTDLLDGYLARKHNLVTDFGKLMDPLADKLLVMAAMVCLIGMGNISALAGVIILSREFLVTSIRLVAAGNGTVIAADKWGKLKTIFQMTWLCLELFALSMPTLPYLLETNDLLMWVTVALTVFSGYNYVRNNKEVFRQA